MYESLGGTARLSQIVGVSIVTGVIRPRRHDSNRMDWAAELRRFATTTSVLLEFCHANPKIRELSSLALEAWVSIWS
jgi:hypothetical protein